jgi:hypothetical protein
VLEAERPRRGHRLHQDMPRVLKRADARDRAAARRCIATLAASRLTPMRPLHGVLRAERLESALLGRPVRLRWRRDRFDATPTAI